MRNPILAATLVFAFAANVMAAERASPSAPRPNSTPATAPMKQTSPGAAPVAIGCHVNPSTAAGGLSFRKVVGHNTTAVFIPAGTRVKWTLNYSMFSTMTGADGKPKSVSIPGTSSGELVLAQPLGAGQFITLESKKSSNGVSYGNCTAFAGP